MTSIFEHLEKDWDHAAHAVSAGIEHLIPHHPHTSAETTAATATIKPDTQEDPMPLLAELEADAKALAAKFATIDHEALAKLETIQANPEATTLLSEVARLAGVPGLPTAILSGATAMLAAIAPAAPAPEQAAATPSFTPAGPLVGGQA